MIMHKLAPQIIAKVCLSISLFPLAIHYSLADDAIEYLGRATIPGSASDASSLNGTFDDGTPRNQLGGFSALDYTGHENRYLVLSDRGPDDGAAPYYCRFHEIDLSTLGSEQNGDRYSARLITTHFLADAKSRPYTGLSTSFGDHQREGGRLDPEGIRMHDANSIVISDEYGPELISFDLEGHFRNQISTPEHYLINNPASTKQEENSLNQVGRQGNGGFEGVDFSSDRKYLYAMLQGPLLQDHLFDNDGKTVGVFARIMRRDLATGETHEYAYPLDGPAYGVSEILSLDDGRLLVLERDSKGGTEAAFKMIYVADLRNADPISANASLPANLNKGETLPDGIRVVEKRPFLNLLDTRFGLAGEAMPRKLEGLTWGPTLGDGRSLLVVCSDNDFETPQSSRFYFFAVNRAPQPGPTE